MEGISLCISIPYDLYAEVDRTRPERFTPEEWIAQIIAEYVSRKWKEEHQ